jgi:hypothetical protein
MYQVEQSPPSEGFQKAWSAAGQHIQKQADNGLSWLRATLNPPMAEHLSFRINQWGRTRLIPYLFPKNNLEHNMLFHSSLTLLVYK